MEISLKMPASEADIKREVTKFSQEIAKRQAEIEMLAKAIEHYQSLCSHPGQKTGYNERDGHWASPCPICGDCR